MINRKQIETFSEFIVTNDFLFIHENHDCFIVSEFITSLKQHFYKTINDIIADAGYMKISTPFFVNEDLFFQHKNDDEKYSYLKTPAIFYRDGHREKNAYLVTPSIDVFTEVLFERLVHSYKNLPLKVFSKTLSLCAREGSLLKIMEGEQLELNCFCETTKLVYEQESIDKLIESILYYFKIKVDKRTNYCETIYFNNDGLEDITLCRYGFLSDEQISRKGIMYTGKNGRSLLPKCINCQISGALFWYFLAFHFDGTGMILPISYLPFEVVILPVYSNQIDKQNLVDYIHLFERFLNKYKISFFTDYNEEESIGNKHYKWEKKGIPIRVEIGNQEYSEKSITIINRYTRQRKFSCREEDVIIELNRVKKLWE